MICNHCGATEGFYLLEDGRTRCSACFATYETPTKLEPKPAVPRADRESYMTPMEPKKADKKR